MSAPVVRLRGVPKSLDEVEFLRGVELDLGRGGVLALLGPSGCGKTTTLRFLAGFYRPESIALREPLWGPAPSGGRVPSRAGSSTATISS